MAHGSARSGVSDLEGGGSGGMGGDPYASFAATVALRQLSQWLPLGAGARARPEPAAARRRPRVRRPGQRHGDGGRTSGHVGHERRQDRVRRPACASAGRRRRSQPDLASRRELRRGRRRGWQRCPTALPPRRRCATSRASFAREDGCSRRRIRWFSGSGPARRAAPLAGAGRRTGGRRRASCPTRHMPAASPGASPPKTSATC